jgi:hypothetical protein
MFLSLMCTFVVFFSVIFIWPILLATSRIDLLRLTPLFTIARSLVSRLLDQGIREGARFLLAPFKYGAVSGFVRLADV